MDKDACIDIEIKRKNKTQIRGHVINIKRYKWATGQRDIHQMNDTTDKRIKKMRHITRENEMHTQLYTAGYIGTERNKKGMLRGD